MSLIKKVLYRFTLDYSACCRPVSRAGLDMKMMDCGMMPHFCELATRHMATRHMATRHMVCCE